MIFSVNIFGGMSPRVASRKLDAKYGKQVINALNTSGDLTPLSSNLQIGSNLLTKLGTKKTIYRFGQDRPTDSDYWFHWTTDVNVVRGSIASDVSERTYFTGDGVPKVTFSPLALTGGGTNYPLASYNLGVPKPDLTGVMGLTVSNLGIASITYVGTLATVTTEDEIQLSSGEKVVIEGATEAVYNGNFEISVIDSTHFTYTTKTVPTANASGTLSYNYGGLPETRVYALTYVSELGEEGAPSVTSNISVTPGQKVIISTIPIFAGAGYSLTKKRIYRTSTGSNQTSLRYVGEVSMATAGFTDRVKSTALGENIPSLNYVEPPSDLSQLIRFSNGMLAGISKNEVCISVPYQPHAWPIAYRYSFNLKPIAIGSFGNSIVVLTNGEPSVLTGSSPEAMSENIVREGYPCVSAESVVEISGGVMWASKQGLAYIGNSGVDLATKNIFTEKEFADYAPESIRAYRWESRYVGFYDTGTTQAGFMFDTQTGEFVELSFYATAGFTDPKNGNLYLAVGDNVLLMAGSSSNATLTWRSKTFTSPKPINLSVAKVVADAYPITFRLFANDVLKFTKTVANGEVFSLPLGYKADNFEIELVSTANIKGVAVAETVRELAGIIE